MFRGKILSGSASFAISAAMLCSTPAVFAQDVVVAPPPVILPAPAPVAAPETVAPPAVVQTASETATASPEPAVAAKPRAARTTARATPKPAAKIAAPDAAPSADIADDSQIASGSTTEIVDAAPVTATVEDTAAVAPLDQTQLDQAETTQIADGIDDDWMIYGGLGAALALAGLGGLLASRRRRNRSAEEPTIVAAHTAVAPRPMPVQQTAAPIERFTAPVMAPVARSSFADQHLPPVTDPLFAHRPVMAPVTDPMFMQQIVLPPVTDPLFANKHEYVGSSSAGAAFDKRRDWKANRNDERNPLHEFAPAE